MKKPIIAILGAGLSGLSAAWQLTRHGLADVYVLERRAEVGGIAGSFELCGLPVDYGSHRLHSACNPEILSDIKEFLGEDLLDRARHGRIGLRNRWIHFPLKLIDLALKLPFSFSINTAIELARKRLKVEEKMR